jgi:hypothetical protein
VEPNIVAERMKAITMLEMLARAMSGLLSIADAGPGRDKAARRLAKIDQGLAARKDNLGLLGKDDCAYLNN